MSKKTAIQELIEWMKKEISFSESMVKQKATELLEKEKNIIVDAYDAGLGDGLIWEDKKMKYRGNLDYFNQTFTTT